MARDLHATKVVVISHAGIKQINRDVYRKLKDAVEELTLIVPAHLQLSSGQRIVSEAATEADPRIVPLTLRGRNPRTYFYPQLIAKLDSLKPDIILLENDPVSRLGVQLAKWARMSGARIICQTYENLRRDILTTIKAQGWKSVPKNLAITTLNHAMSKVIDALLVVNRESEWIFQGYGYKNLTRIPLGYDSRVFFVSAEKRHEYRCKLNVAPESVVVAYFGRLVRQKGVHLLIQALKDLRSSGWMLLLDHVHDSEDDYVRYIQSLIKEFGLEDRVKYFEADHFEIANYMRAADIVVAPSITTPSFKEQYGRAVQEAMACGCVCLVSDSGHLKDLVADDFLVFAEGDVEMLGAKIRSLIADAAVRNSVKTSLAKRALTTLTSDRQSQEIAAVIQKVIS